MSDSKDLTGYDMVIALTQDAINNVLKYSPILSVPINYGAKTTGLEGVTIAHAAFGLTGENVPVGQASLEFTFGQGTLKYHDPYDGEIKEDISQWTMQIVAPLAFEPSLTADEVANYEDLPSSVQEALSNTATSVSSLTMDMGGMSPDAATVTKSDGTVVPAGNEKSALTEGIQRFFAEAQQLENKFILNYLLSGSGGTAAGEAIPGFVPTAYNFSVTPYNPAGDNDNLSTINYLIMTENRKPPTDTSTGVFTNNWVPAPNSNADQGVVSIDAKLFNLSYVEPILLPQIVKAVGYSQAATGNTSSPWQYSNSSNPRNDYGNQNDGKGKSLNDGLGSNLECVYVNTLDWVDFKVTQNADATYSVEGTYTTRANYTVELIGWGATDSKCHQDYTMQFSFQVSLSATEDGAVTAIASGYSRGGTQESDWEGDNLGGDVFATLNQIAADLFSSVDQGFQNLASQMATTNFSNAADDLNNAFDGLSSSIVFPGARNFDFKELRFTTDSEANLEATVSY